jgi:hypothetical protein
MFGSGSAAWVGRALIGVVLAVAVAPAARAQAPDEATLAAARQLGQEGVALYMNGDYATASDKLERAYAVVKVPTLGLWSGRAFEKLGKLVEALQRYREVTLFELKPTDPAIFRSSQSDARAAYDALLGRMPQLTVELEGASAAEVTLTIDGKSVPSALIGAAIPVNPGTHQLEARREGELASGSLTLKEGDKRQLTLAFHPIAAVSPTEPGAETPVAPVPEQSAVSGDDDTPVASPATTEVDEVQHDEGGSAGPWILIAAGGAAAAGGGVLLGLALSAKSKVEDDDIEDGADWSDYESDADKVPVLSTIGFALIGAGAAALTAGIVWQLSSGDDRETGLSLRVGPTSLAIAGRL